MALVLAVIDYDGSMEAYLAASEDDANRHVRSRMEQDFLFHEYGDKSDLEVLEDAILAERLGCTVTIGGNVSASLSLNMDDLKQLFSQPED